MAKRPYISKTRCGHGYRYHDNVCPLGCDVRGLSPGDKKEYADRVRRNGTPVVVEPFSRPGVTPSGRWMSVG